VLTRLTPALGAKHLANRCCVICGEPVDRATPHLRLSDEHRELVGFLHRHCEEKYLAQSAHLDPAP
jgi:hypothetical protein